MISQTFFLYMHDTIYSQFLTKKFFSSENKRKTFLTKKKGGKSFGKVEVKIAAIEKAEGK